MEPNPVFVDVHQEGIFFPPHVFIFFCSGVISAMCADVTQTYAGDYLLPMGSFPALVWRENPSMHKTELQAFLFFFLSVFFYYFFYFAHHHSG